MENEIKVGEYVRTEVGVSKIKRKESNFVYEVDKNGTTNMGKISFRNYVHTDDIVKHSSNLIDLIQYGDYVNGYKVDNIEKGKLIIGDTTQVIEQIVENNEIETVVTKEMMESIIYRVERN